jgi:NADH-quinone oxidoreductase subunit H
VAAAGVRGGDGGAVVPRRWRGPVLPDWLWSLVKTAAVLAVLVWVGRRLPTIRMERFTEVAWMVLVPATLLQALFVSIVVI